MNDLVRTMRRTTVRGLSGAFFCLLIYLWLCPVPAKAQAPGEEVATLDTQISALLTSIGLAPDAPEAEWEPALQAKLTVAREAVQAEREKQAPEAMRTFVAYLRENLDSIRTLEKELTRANRPPKTGTAFVNTIGMWMEWVDANPAAGVPQGLWVSRYEVTQQQYETVQRRFSALFPGQKPMSTNTSRFRAADRPVENVKWGDGVRFSLTLTMMEEAEIPEAGYQYSLPWAVEWKHFAKGATTGDSVTSIRGGASGTRSVGGGSPNPFGIYDLMGNVREWLSDDWTPGLNDDRSLAGSVPFLFGSKPGHKAMAGAWWELKDGSGPFAKYNTFTAGDPGKAGTDGQTGFRVVLRAAR